MMIVLMHSPHPNTDTSAFIQAPLYFITASGLCLFFMVSGALLLPVKIDTFTFLKHRLGKIVVPLLFWTLFYMGIKLLVGEASWNETLHSIISIPFTRQGHGVLWFLYVLIGLYLLSPIISPMLQMTSKKELRFYLQLWGIALCYPLFAPFVELTVNTYGILYYFSGFAGYYVLGYYLHTYCKKMGKFCATVLFVLPIVAFVVCYAAGMNKMFSDIFWYEGIAVAVMCIAWFIVVRKFMEKRSLSVVEAKFLTTLSNCTFGVYLMHVFIMRRLLWQSDFVVYGLGSIGQIIMTWVGTLIISFVLVLTLSYLPYSEYIIGFTNRKRK
jgi:surface polysaccharide O-acyltransferase-like enzyme